MTSPFVRLLKNGSGIAKSKREDLISSDKVLNRKIESLRGIVRN